MQTEEYTTTLADLICAVPCLAKACISAQQGVADTAHSGVKTLRLLCKSTCVVMFQHIKGCAFELGMDISNNDILAFTRFLQGCQLLRLALVILPMPPGLLTEDETLWHTMFAQTGNKRVTSDRPVWGDLGHRASTAQDAEQVSSQLELVLSGLGPTALRNITQLQLDLQDIRSHNEHCCKCDESKSHITMLGDIFLAVAHGCLAVRHLRVAGSIGRAVMNELGANCTQLESLEVVCGDVLMGSLEDLHLLLPHLANLKLLPSDREIPRYACASRLTEHNERVSQQYAQTLINHCNSYPVLANLGASWLREEYTDLPPAFLHARLALHVYTRIPPRAHWRVWPGLTCLIIHTETDGLDLHQVGRLVTQAPNMTSLHVIGAHVITYQQAHFHHPIEDSKVLILLGKRCRDGLKITAADENERPLQMTLAVCAWHYPSANELTATEILNQPVTTSAVELILQELAAVAVTASISPGLCISSAKVGHSFHLLPSIFPNITSLTFIKCEIHGEELASLGSLSSLCHLTFVTCKYLSPTELRDVCFQLQDLKCVACIACFGVGKRAAMSLQWALGDEVEVRHEDNRPSQYLEYEIIRLPHYRTVRK